MNTIVADRLFSDPRLKRLTRELGCPAKALGVLVWVWHGSQNLGVSLLSECDILDVLPIGIRGVDRVVCALVDAAFLERVGSDYRVIGNEEHVQAREKLSKRGKDAASKRWGSSDAASIEVALPTKMPVASAKHDGLCPPHLTSPHLTSPTSPLNTNTNTGSGSLPSTEIIEAASTEFELRAQLPKQPKAKRVAAAKPEPTDTAKVRRAFLDGYAARLPKAGAYPWGARENAQAERWLRSVPLPEALVMVAKFFEWSRPEVVRSGYPFGTGSNCLIMKYVELKGDMAHPERRAFAAIADDVENQDNRRAQNAGQSQRVLASLAQEREHARLERPTTTGYIGTGNTGNSDGQSYRSPLRYPQPEAVRRGPAPLDEPTDAVCDGESDLESSGDSGE